MLARRVVLLVAWLTPACVDGQEARVKEYCRVLCELETTCSNTFDIVRTPAMERQCQRDCLADSYTHATREDALPFVEDCLTEHPCERDLQQPAEGVDGPTNWLTQQANAACLAEASEEIEGSETCQEFCEDRAALPGCAATSVAECQGTYCAFADEVVLERRECFEIEDCTERRICLEIVRE
jgi:hypothetical protein